MRLRALSHHRILLLAESLLMTAIAAAILSLRPFREIARGVNRSATTAKPLAEREIVAIGRAIASVSRYVPWRAKCFEQGLAAYWMLRRRGVIAALHYGARLSEGKMEGHVWVSTNEIIVTGGERQGEFSEIMVFPDGLDHSPPHEAG